MQSEKRLQFLNHEIQLVEGDCHALECVHNYAMVAFEISSATSTYLHQVDPHPSIPRSHYNMLHDHARNDAYRNAIERAVQRRTEFMRESAHVIDIGAGSGIFSLFAAEAGATAVNAVEFNPALVKV